MKRFALAAFTSILVLGCKPQVTVSGVNGEKVTSDTSGNMTVTDDKGNSVAIKTGQGTFDEKASNGAEAHFGQNGMTGKDDKGGTYSVGGEAVTESDLGLPFYPGSTPVEHRDIKSTDASGKKMALSVRTTSDTPEKVAAFYKDKVTNPSSFSSDQTSTIGGKLTDGRGVAVVATVTAGKTQIDVTTSTDK